MPNSIEEQTKTFLEKLSRLPDNATILITGKVDNDTRKGNYITVKSGLSNTVHFIGKNEKDQIITEYVNG
jgi:signal recognition particle GTPase